MEKKKTAKIIMNQDGTKTISFLDKGIRIVIDVDILYIDAETTEKLILNYLELSGIESIDKNEL